MQCAKCKRIYTDYDACPYCARADKQYNRFALIAATIAALLVTGYLRWGWF